MKKSLRLRNFWISFLFVCSAYVGLTQKFQFAGQLFNSSKEPIPFAHFRIQDSNAGFISTDKGIFEFFFDNNEITVEITAIGYKNATYTVPANKHMLLYLEEDLLNLNEVVVTYIDKERELLKKVLKNIPNNYPKKHEQIQGKVIEQLALDKDLKRVIYESEALIVADKMPYQERTSFGNVSLIDGNLEIKKSLDSSFVRIYAGLHNVHRFDIMAKREIPFDNIDNEKYDFIIKDTLKLNGKVVFSLSFTTPKRIGKLWIEDESYALIKAYYEDTPRALKPFLPRNSKRLFKNVTVEYTSSKDIFRLSYINYKTAFERKEDQRTVFLNNLFYLENHDSELKVIPLAERNHFTDFLLYELQPEQVLSDNISTADAKKMNRKIKAERILRRLSNQLSIGIIAYSSEAFETFDNENTDEITEIIPSVSWDIGYHLNTKNAFVFSFLEAMDRSFSMVNINYEHTLPLSRSGKWILTFSSGLHYFESEHSVTSFFDDRLALPNRVAFNPNRVVEYANGFGLLGGLQLNRRLSGMFSLVAKASLPFSLTEKKEFIFSDDKNQVVVQGEKVRLNNFYSLSLGVKMNL